METEYFATYHHFLMYLTFRLEGDTYDSNPQQASYLISEFISDNDQETVDDVIESLLVLEEIKDREDDRLYYEAIFRTDNREPEIEFYVPCQICDDGLGFWEGDGDPSNYAKKYGFERINGKNICESCRMKM